MTTDFHEWSPLLHSPVEVHRGQVCQCCGDGWPCETSRVERGERLVAELQAWARWAEATVAVRCDPYRQLEETA